MGILNVTPDSFYDLGRYRSVESATDRAAEMEAEGADIIDVGGERAGPGDAVGINEEIGRVVPIIKKIRARSRVRISVDTYKPDVAAAAIGAGATMINSISGFDDPDMRDLAARSEVEIVIMHIQGKPRVHQPNPTYGSVVAEVAAWLSARADLCIQAGVAADRIVTDPGPGFGKSSTHDLALLRNLRVLTAGSYPVMLAASRKSVVGHVLDLPAEERLEGSLATAAWAVLQGVRIVRVHDVRATVRTVRMVEAVLDPATIQGQAL